MTPFLLLALALQGAPVEAEKQRIREKPPLCEEERKAYSLPPAPVPAKPRAGYRLAVVPLGFSDAPATRADLQAFFFEQLSGAYLRASGGRFKLEGKVFPAAALQVEREKFRRPDLKQAMSKEVKAFDGVAFVVPGELAARGTPLWPHQGTVEGVDYILVPADAGERAAGIAAHEFMHLLGFEDKYDDEKAAVGRWCILGAGFSPQDPPPPCVECRARLGWTSPSRVDPSAKSAVVLDADPSRAVRVPLTPDDSEALLLEMRDRLFVWHVGGGKKIELLGRYPTETSDRLTPLSDPPFRGRSVGARAVWITDIRLERGKAWFRVAPEAPLTPLEEWRRANVGKRLGE